MKYILDRKKYNFKFSKYIKPILTINSKDIVVFKTRDAHNQIVPKENDIISPDICENFKISQSYDCPVGIIFRLAFPKTNQLFTRENIFK